MDLAVWFPFIGSLTGHLAWPVSLVILALIFKTDLKSLLKRIKSVEGPAKLKAEFAEVIEETKLDFPALPQAEEQQTKKGDRSVLDRPAAIVLDSWRKLADALEAVRHAHRLDLGPGSNMTLATARALVKVGLLKESMLPSLERLRRLRDKVAHYEFEPDEDDALTFQLLASTLADYVSGGKFMMRYVLPEEKDK